MNEAIDPSNLKPGTRVGHWRVVEKLGVGGYGAVYRVEDESQPGRFYALKLAFQRRQEAHRALREVTLHLSKAAHPNVVPVHAFGHWPDPDSGLPFFVMDEVQGLPAHLWAETVNPSFLRFAEAIGKVALTLDALHSRGVLHRDLKPENLLIRSTDDEPLLIDLGVSWYEDADTLTDAVLPPGTLHLRSPESLRFLHENRGRPGARYVGTPADDRYALGLCAFRMVTGHFPFPPNADPDWLALMIETQVPPSPSAFNRRVPKGLGDIIQRLLSKKPEDRYASGAAVREALVAAATFGRRREWEAPLFEWEEAPTEGRAGRIRRPEWPTRPQSAPLGPSLLLRGPGELARKKLKAVGAPPARPAPWSGRVKARGMLLGMALLLSVLGTWGMMRRASPSPPVPPPAGTPAAQTAMGHEVAQPPQASETGRVAAPLTAGSTPAAVAPSTRHKEAPPLKKKPSSLPTPTHTSRTSRVPLAAALALCLEGSGCASVPLRPMAEDCPAEARASMKRLGLKVGELIFFDVDSTDTRDRFHGSQEVIIRDGPLVGVMSSKREELPPGTRFYGYLWTNTGKFSPRGEPVVYGRYDKIVTPDGKEHRVCFALARGAADELRGFFARVDPKSGALTFPFDVSVIPVHRFFHE